MSDQIVLTMRSRKLKMNTEVCVLLPPSVPGEPKRKHPVLWLLHGGSCDWTTCLYHDHVEELLRGRDVITLIPNAQNSDFANHSEWGMGYLWTDFFFEELLPYAQAFLPVSPDPKENYIAGFSMGGAGALMLSLYRPEAFGKAAVLGSSMRESEFLTPYLSLSGAAFRRLALADPKAFPTEYGDPREGITLKEINMISRYDTVKDYVDSMECTGERFRERAREGRICDTLFCCGDRDSCYEKVLKAERLAKEEGISHVDFAFLPGLGHDRADAAIAQALDWMGL